MKRNTKQGEIIVSVIRSAERPLTPLEIYQLAVEKIPRLGIATTYRHLKSLTSSQQVVGVDYPGQPLATNGRTEKTRFILRAEVAINFLPLKITLMTLLLPKHPRDLRYKDSRLCYMEPAPTVSRINLERIANTKSRFSSLSRIQTIPESRR